MKINVTENKVSIKEEQILNENEYNIHKIQFDFSSEYTDDLVKIALFSIDNHTYKKIISNNECDIPPEVLTQRGYSILGVYAYKTEQDTLVLRYSPSPTKISVYDGSYKADAENSEPITPSEIEQYQQILQNSLQQFQNQYNALVEETEGDIQAIEDELQRKVDEGYFDGEDGFSPIAKVIQKSNGATIEIEDKNGKTTADVLNGEDGYTPVRGVDYWTEEDKQEVEEEATQQIEGKIEEYNENAAEKLNQYNQNSVQKTNDYNTNAEQKMSAYNTNATEKTSTYNTNATEKFNNYNSNAEQKETNYNTNASSKLSEYNSNAETKKSAYDENATQKTNSFNTNATNKLTEYNTNHTEKMSAYNSNSTEKLNSFNENATQKTEDFDEHTEEIQDKYNRLKATLPTTGEVTGQAVTLNKTAELEFKKPPLPMGNSEQESYKGYNLYSAGNQTFEINKYVDIEPIPAGTYKLIGNFQTTDTDSTICLLSFAKDNVEVGFRNVRRGNISTTVTLSDEANIIRMYASNNYNNSIGDTATFSNIMITNTDVTDTDYEPYVGETASPNPDYPQEITNVTGDVEVKVQNKNLALNDNPQNPDANYSSSGGGTSAIQYSTQDSGYYTTNHRRRSFGILKAGSYTLSIKAKKRDGNSGFVILTEIKGYAESIMSKSSLTNNYTKYTYTFTILENKEFAVIFYNSLYWKDIQLEKGTTSTDYVEHKQQTFTFPLGNEKLMLGDYLADDGIHHVREQYAFTGNENIQKYSQSTYAFGIYTNVNIKHSSIVDSVLCNKLQHTALDTIWRNRENANNNLISSFTNGFGIMMNNYTDVNDLKEYLTQQYQNETPVIAEYELAEEVIVPYTSAQQEVYNQIKQAISYEEQTNISSNQNALFSVEAYQDAKVILAEKGTYSKPSTGIPKTDLASAVQTSLNKADTAIQEHQDISGKQDITDNTLTTINKTVPTAINEVNSIAKGANQALSYGNYSTMITAFNSLANNVYNVGQNVMIITLQVPDLWISGIESTSQTYTYTTDEAFTTELNTNGYVQVGYYKLSALETQKVDLTNYVTFNDYATSTTAGVVKTNSMYGVSTSSYTQNITATTKTYDQYQSSNNATFVGKGTLENVITGKNLESANNKTTTISSSSTDNEYPSAKAVYDYIQSILNN